MTDLAYHLQELEIHRHPDDPRHVMPRLPAHFSSVLDIGCGIGQTLITADVPRDALAVGIDLDYEALAYGRKLSAGTGFVKATGEKLPFAAESFDVVYSRVALPWMHIPSALAEVFRVAKPGAYVWFSLVRFSDAIRQTTAALKALKPKNVLYRSYVLVNGIWFHATAKQFRFPLRRARCESFQTTRGMMKAMSMIGFQDIRVEREQFFVVTARKPA